MPPWLQPEESNREGPHPGPEGRGESVKCPSPEMQGAWWRSPTFPHMSPVFLFSPSASHQGGERPSVGV